MELGSIVSFLEGKTILITGAAGFLSKIFLEKVLRVQPSVQKIYLLLRARDSEAAALRLQNEIIEKDLFRILKKKWGEALSSFIAAKTSLVVGDISEGDELGIKDSSLREEIYNSVDFVINLAAATNFVERYDVAFEANTMGAIHVLNFAGKCINLKALVHVSTAYVAREMSGLIKETPFELNVALNGSPGLDIDNEKKLIKETLDDLQSIGATSDEVKDAMKDLGLERAKSYGWPNTYVFTKAMGEMLVERWRGTMSVAVVRPAIVTSTYKEPFPAWIEGFRTIDTLTGGYAKGRLNCVFCNFNATIDLIPADIVVNAMLVIMASHAKQPHARIYHIGSSARNPVTYKDLCRFAHTFFTEKPWIGKDGRTVIVKEPMILGSMTAFHIYLAIRYTILLKFLELIKVMFAGLFKELHDDQKKKLRFVMRLAELYTPYTFFTGIFDDTNTERLRMATRFESEGDTIYFDPMCIKWEEYFLNVHLAGGVNYLFK